MLTMFKNKIKKINLALNEEGHLSDLKLHQKAVVLALHNHNPAIKRHLLDMGITTGVEIEIEGFAPLGDPVRVFLRGYSLAMRLQDMREIDIRRIA